MGERGEGVNPAEETVSKIVNHLADLDAAMEQEGFSHPTRQRTITEVIAHVLEKSLTLGLIRIEIEGPSTGLGVRGRRTGE
jgi:hypothetical protein